MAYLFFRHIRRNALPAKQEYISLCKSVSKDLGSKEPRIIQTPHTKSVFLAGFFHPCIVLPNDGLEVNLATKEIFLHELVHLKRHDYIWNYLCQIGKILLPFQPFMWILIGKIRDVSDYVCDDYVVQHGKDSRSYAVQLFNLAQSFQIKRLREPNGVGLVSKLPLRKRIERILDDSLHRLLKLSYPHRIGIIILFFSSIFLSGYVGVKPVESYHTLKRSVRTIENTLTVQYLRTRAAGLHLRETGSSGENTKITVIKGEPSDHRQLHKTVYTQKAVFENESITQPVDENKKPEFGIGYTELPVMKKEILSSDREKFDKGQSETSQATENKNAETNFTSSVLSVTEMPDSSDSMISNNDVRSLESNLYTVNANEYYAGVSPGPVEIVRSFDWENTSHEESEYSRLKQLYGNLDKCSNPKWSPDGSMIGFEAAVAMWIVPAIGGEPSPIYDSIGKQLSDETGMVIGGETGCWKLLGFTPDSSEMTFVINIYDPERGSVNEMVNMNGYYMSTIYGAVPLIVSVVIKSGLRRTIVEESSSGRWSASGKYFAYQKLNLEVNITRQRYYNTHVIKGIGDPEYEALLYDNLNEGLFVKDMETGAEWLVAEKGMEPCFVPDDSCIIFTGKDEAGLIQLYKVQLDGSNKEQLTYYSAEEDGHNVSSPEVSPDGAWILHSGEMGDDKYPYSGLFLYYIPSGETFRFDADKEHYVDSGVWSPDGTQILYNIVEYPEMNSVGFYIADFDPNDYIEPSAIGNITPVEFALTGNYPNPFNPVTSIKFSLDKDGYTELFIYNIMGQKVRELIKDEQSAGIHTVVWDGRDDEKRPVSSGIYISRLKMEGNVETLRMTLVK